MTCGYATKITIYNCRIGAIVARLSADLAGTRMDRANLLAAIRATLGAHADGDADPLSYLRDELAEFTERGDG